MDSHTLVEDFCTNPLTGQYMIQEYYGSFETWRKAFAEKVKLGMDYYIRKTFHNYVFQTPRYEWTVHRDVIKDNPRWPV